jgi:SpoVK/Ycf46/Vps4 family AAA+-type ATPase
LPVYRIDLSMLASEYAGETEKNLACVFEQAGQKDWILFFDEADALFGKRGANEDVARLLQRIEDFPGVAILASNLDGSIDEAYVRRFQSMLHFPMPGRTERLRLWQGAFAPPCRLAPDCAFDALADEFELSGGAIINVLRYAALVCLRRGSGEIVMDDIRQGVRRELRKDACLPLPEKR